MKKIFLLLLPIFLFSCIRNKKGSGVIITETKNVGAFNAIDVAGSINVELVQGSNNEVTIGADDNIIKYIQVVNKDGVLKVRLTNSGSIRKFTANVKITSALFSSIVASSSVDVTSTNLLTATDKINITASSSSNVELNVDAPNIIAECSSSGTIEIKGKTKQLNATAKSSADIKAENLQAETVIANASSSGTVNVFASVKLDATASSSGDIHYTGGVTDIVKKESSSGSVSPK